MISPQWTIPEVLERYPAARSVFDRHGLHGCGGERGPRESLEFFARVHGIDLERLLADLEVAARGETTATVPYRESLADTLYRRHFKAAILVLFTAGATLGAVLLFLMAQGRSLTRLELLPFVQAHANAQVFGWVGLFVMGFALQGLPRFKYVKLWRPSWANGAFVLMLAGLALRTSAPLLPVAGTPAALAGGILQAAAAALFVAVLWRTLSPATLREPWDRYVFTAAALFLLAAVLEPVVTAAFAAASTEKELIGRIADFAGPLRDVQVLGFAGLMIFGVSQRVLPTAFGFRAVGARTSAAAFVLLSGGLAVDVAGWLAFRGTREPAWAALSWAGILMYAAGAATLAITFRGLTGGAPDRSRKFIRAAFLWLIFACVLVAAQPLYARLMGLRFSHGYAGAARHAFTVGFVSLMIVGISSKVVPILAGADPRRLPALGASFVLIIAGNGLRVFTEILTDAAPRIAFPVMGFSGVLQVAGFLLWGIHLWKLMGSTAAAPAAAPRPDRIEGDMTPAEVVEWFPETLEVFSDHGFGLMQNPLLRRTLGRSITLAGACAMKKVDLGKFLEALNRTALPTRKD